ncbi:MULTISPECIES: hypothetical protein [Bradyrhizobium]|uniref:Uncharacterized protein n=2 Tax=Bradyrhizobium TaxID=374 RepID=A0A5D3KJL7_9BRAD|nr:MULTISPECIES: hypothetical protein [Bradyrhizobium]OSJ36688.1 hypothetical protein BSZ19_03055 [Bradyrhizobium japonicum]TYL97553.1 hypothetical protein FXB40_09390 [Bradyrhizobium rifense]WOH75385.1 hypothetical protein RX330_09770 [Bradyrhizobium sp. NDS-1]
MSVRINREYVNDTAKLIMHRLIARQIGRDPSLVERAKDSLAHNYQRFEGYAFVREWSDMLGFPPSTVRRRLTSRDEEMTRLRLSSPFVLAEGINFEDDTLRRRIWKAAKRIAERSAIHQTAGLPRMAA